MTRRSWRSAVSSLLYALLASGFVVCIGCGRAAPLTTKKGAGPGVSREKPLEVAREYLRKATATSHYRDALDQVSNYLADNPEKIGEFQPKADKARLVKLLPATEKVDGLDERALYRRLLHTRFQLFDDEVDSLLSNRFTPLDAHHVEFCYHLRDVALSLQLQGLERLQQVELCFQWVVRHVSLRENDSDLLPPQLTLQRGYGSARERALLFLALLHQAGIDGCTVAFPDAALPNGYRHFLAGVLSAEKGPCDVWLYDMRLGVPLKGPGGKGVATLEQLKKHPKLLELFDVGDTFKYDVDATRLKSAEIQLVSPLAALSPRMDYLEAGVLGMNVQIRLALPPLKLLDRFEAAGVGPIQIWNWPGDDPRQPPNSAVRALRLALPAQEGGLDRTDKHARVFQETVPWPALRLQMHSLQLNDLPRELRESLFGIYARIFERYLLTPRNHLRHGRLEEAPKQVEHILGIIHEFAQRIQDNPESRKTVADWRARALHAHGLWKNEGRSVDWERLWAEDQWLVELLAGSDDPAKRKEEPLKAALSQVVFQIVAEPLRNDALFLKALNWHEKAHRFQARLERKGGAGAIVVKDAESAWKNAKDAWQMYLNRTPLGDAEIQNRLQAIRELFHSKELGIAKLEERNLALELLGQFFHDVRRVATARFLQAQSYVKTGDARTASSILTKLTSDLDNVQKNQDLADFRKELQAVQDPLLQTPVQQMYSDFDASGTFYWLRYAAGYRVAQLAGK